MIKGGWEDESRLPTTLYHVLQCLSVPGALNGISPSVVGMVTILLVSGVDDGDQWEFGAREAGCLDGVES